MQAENKRIEEENYRLMGRIIDVKPSAIVIKGIKKGQKGHIVRRGSPAYD